MRWLLKVYFKPFDRIQIKMSKYINIHVMLSCYLHMFRIGKSTEANNYLFLVKLTTFQILLLFMNNRIRIQSAIIMLIKIAK